MLLSCFLAAEFIIVSVSADEVLKNKQPDAKCFSSTPLYLGHISFPAELKRTSYCLDNNLIIYLFLFFFFFSAGDFPSSSMEEHNGSAETPPPSQGRHSAIKCGWLRKQGGFVKTWHTRWFVLKGDQLYYFKDEDETKPLVSDGR